VSEVNVGASSKRRWWPRCRSAADRLFARPVRAADALGGRHFSPVPLEGQPGAQRDAFLGRRHRAVLLDGVSPGRATTPADTTRPYCAWGYPWTTWAAIFVGVVFIVCIALSDQRNAMVALAILLADYPVYRGTRHLFGRKH
jgi:hypothetical protein